MVSELRLSTVAIFEEEKLLIQTMYERFTNRVGVNHYTFGSVKVSEFLTTREFT